LTRNGLGTVDMVVLAADGRFEVTNSLPEGTPNLREPLGPEHEERDHEDEEQMCWLKDVADHVTELSWIVGPR
jgi:hypothetical protein